MTLEVDDFGNVLKSVAIGYGRRFADRSPRLTDADRDKQRKILLTFTENKFTNPVREPDSYRTPLPAETRKYELIHLRPEAAQPGITNLFRFAELKAQVARASDGRHDLPYEDIDAAGATEDAPYRRLIEESRSYYRARPARPNTAPRCCRSARATRTSLQACLHARAARPNLPPRRAA